MSCYAFWHPCNTTHQLILLSGIHQQRLQFAEDADTDTGTWRQLPSSWFEKEDHWCTRLKRAELECKAWLLSLWFVSSTHHPLQCQAAPPVKFPRHSDPISPMTSAILLSSAGYQTEVGIQITFCCLPLLCSHTSRRQGEKPCLLQQKRSSEMTVILVCINKVLGANPRNTTRGDKSPVKS